MVCDHCGSQVFIWNADEAPDCLNCFLTTEKAQLAAEKVVTGLAELRALVADLRPAEREAIRADLPVWRVELELLNHEVTR